MTVIKSMKALREAATRHGSHMFEPATLRWWNSTVLNQLYPTSDATGYFITSDGTPGEYGITDGVKAYVIRRYAEGDILDFETVLRGGVEAQFYDLAQAKSAADVLAGIEKRDDYAAAQELAAQFSADN